MNERELREVLVRAIREIAPEVDPAGIDPDASLTEQLELDSMDLLNVVVSVHEQTGIDIPERDYPKLATLNDVIAYLASAQRAR